MDLSKVVKSVQVLNIDESNSTISPQQLIEYDSIKDANSYIASDADEELIILVEFAQPIELKNIRFYALELKDNGDDDDDEQYMSAPKEVNVYKLAHLNYDFDGIKDLQPDKCVTCASKKLRQGQVMNVTKNIRNLLAFKKVSFLAVYIKSNQGGTEHTFLHGMTMNGVFDDSAFKTAHSADSAADQKSDAQDEETANDPLKPLSVNELWPNNAEQDVGLQIWRVEAADVQEWPKERYGEFYGCDAYIMLRTSENDEGKKAHDVFCWVGGETLQATAESADAKSVELVELLSGDSAAAVVQYHEVQGNESQAFLSCFPQVSILHGSVDGDFHAKQAEEYKPRLLRVTAFPKHVQVYQVKLDANSLSDSDAFVLDCGSSVYQFNGSHCSAWQKRKANAVVDELQAARFGQVKSTLVIDGVGALEEDGKYDAFWAYLGGEPPCIFGVILPGDFRDLAMAQSGTNAGKFSFQYRYEGSWRTSSYQLSADGGIGIQNGRVVAQKNGNFWRDKTEPKHTWKDFKLYPNFGYRFTCQVKQSNNNWVLRSFDVNRYVNATATGVKWQ